MDTNVSEKPAASIFRIEVAMYWVDAVLSVFIYWGTSDYSLLKA
jgi:hypothetical protein